MYSAAHVKGKHYTSVGSVSYTPVNSCLDEGALQATCTHDCGRRRAHTLAVGVADFSESPIIEIELRFDREANINRSEGEGEL